MCRSDRSQPRPINVAVSARRMFFRQTMQRPELVAAVRTVRADDRLPELLSAAEVASLIDHARTPKHRAMLMLFYGTGMRTSELTHLRVCDVDGDRAVIHLRDIKSRRDRIVPLPERAREAMRAYWCGCRVRPRGTDLLFPGRGQPLTRAVVDRRVRAKAPFGGAEQVHSYIGRHTHRVGIANSRIRSMDDRGVTFATTNGGVETVSGVAFLQRFAEHVLPKGFTRIRHHGPLAPSHATTTLEQARALSPVDACRRLHAEHRGSTAAPPPDVSSAPGAHAPTWIELLRELTGEDAERCPRCGTGRLVRRAPEHGPAPPRRDTS